MIHIPTQRDEATNLRLQRLNDVMAAKMRSSSIEPKPADEEAETAGLDLMSLLVNPVARGVLPSSTRRWRCRYAVDARATALTTQHTGLVLRDGGEFL